MYAYSWEVPIGDPILEDEKKVLHTGRFIQMVKLGRWEFVERINLTGIVIIAAITEEGKVLLVEQFRPPMGCNCIELPAGLAGDKGKESDEDAVGRELAEEAGYQVTREPMYMGHGVVTPGLTSECAAMYLAYDVKKMANPPKDEEESITLHEVHIHEIDEWLAKKRAEGLAIDWKIYTALYFFRSGRRGWPAPQGGKP